MSLTKAQTAILAAIRQRGYIRSSFVYGNTLTIPEYPNRIRYDTLQALRHAGHLRVESVRPRAGRFPDGETNRTAVSVLIYVPVEAPMPTRDQGRVITSGNPQAVRDAAKAAGVLGQWSESGLIVPPPEV